MVLKYATNMHLQNSNYITNTSINAIYFDIGYMKKYETALQQLQFINL